MQELAGTLGPGRAAAGAPSVPHQATGVARRATGLHGQVSGTLALPILRGEHQPGSALPTEPELCRALGVSRTTLREAVKNLAAKGLVEVGPRTGTRVRPRHAWNLLDGDVVRWRLSLGVDARLVQDIYEMRECFEPRAAAFAAERGSEEEHAAVGWALDAMAASGADAEAAVEADVRFHAAILLASGNPFLRSFTPMIEETLRACFRIARHRVRLSPDDLSQHGAVLSALRRRNPAMAERATQRLLRVSKAVQMRAAADEG